MNSQARPLRWQDAANCATTDPEVFFPQQGESVQPALAICRRCDVRAECLEFALSQQDDYGVLGGMSPTQRYRLRRDRRERGAA